MLAKTIALAFALTAAALENANAGPVDVTFEVSGHPGAWTVDFTFANQLSSPASLYFLGVKADGFLASAPSPFVSAFAPTYNTSAAGGQDITYNNLWLDLGLTGLPQGQSLSGFTVSVAAASVPSSFEWFAMTRGAPVDHFDFGSPTTAGFQGVVTLAPAIPEPETYALFSLGLCLLIARNRKRLPHPG